VLVVEDNHDAAETLSDLLELSGYPVKVAHSGLAALDAAREFGPEVVLCDIGLPGIDGYEVARRLRAEHGAERMLLVALTGYGQEEDRLRSREAGFHHHLVKPPHPEALLRLLELPVREP
jgi:CheY-like chemotaxis protein